MHVVTPFTQRASKPPTPLSTSYPDNHDPTSPSAKPGRISKDLTESTPPSCSHNACKGRSCASRSSRGSPTLLPPLPHVLQAPPSCPILSHSEMLSQIQGERCASQGGSTFLLGPEAALSSALKSRARPWGPWTRALSILSRRSNEIPRIVPATDFCRQGAQTLPA